MDWQIVLVLAPIALELLRQAVGARFDANRLFYLDAPSPWLFALVLVATVLCVATPIKIWNNARIEHRLQEQEKLLLAAKISALASQINPHFLFNTLTSISSLIRSQPETARMVVHRLSALLRRRLRDPNHFVTPARRARSGGRVPRHRADSLRAAAARAEADRPAIRSTCSCPA